MIKKVPMRKCVVTQEIHPKKDLLRIVRTPEGQVIVDLKGKVNGRGAYISKSLKTLDLAIKKKQLEKVLETAIDSSVYETLRKIISDSIE